MKNIGSSPETNLAIGFYALIILLLVSFSGFTQNVAISPSGAVPNSSAGLDVNYPDKGLLIPRVALAVTTASTPLSAPVAAGMIVYNTATAGDVMPGFYYHNGTKWVPFITNYTPGDMLYWDGSAWKKLAKGAPGQFLQLNSSNIPTWVTKIVYN